MADEEKKNPAENVGKKILSYLDKGVEASCKGLKSAGNAISDFGDKSVIRIELSQLKSKQEKKFKELGAEVFNMYSKENVEAITLTDGKLSQLIKEISDIQTDIEKHEASLK